MPTLQLNEKEKNDFVKNHLIMVKKIVSSMHKKVFNIEREEMIHWGTIGLLDAMNRYESTDKNTFETFAAFRIKGQILDELRSLDGISRGDRAMLRKIKVATGKIEQQNGGKASDVDVAKACDISLDDYFTLKQRDSYFKSTQYAEGTGKENDEDLVNESLSIPDENVNTSKMVEQKDQIRVLLQKVEKLGERDRHLVKLLYEDGLTMQEVGDIFQITESRICQLNAALVQKLKLAVEIENRPNYNKVSLSRPELTIPQLQESISTIVIGINTDLNTLNNANKYNDSNLSANITEVKSEKITRDFTKTLKENRQILKDNKALQAQETIISQPYLKVGEMISSMRKENNPILPFLKNASEDALAVLNHLNFGTWPVMPENAKKMETLFKENTIDIISNINLTGLSLLKAMPALWLSKDMSSAVVVSELLPKLGKFDESAQTKLMTTLQNISSKAGFENVAEFKSELSSASLRGFFINNVDQININKDLLFFCWKELNDSQKLTTMLSITTNKIKEIEEMGKQNFDNSYPNISEELKEYGVNLKSASKTNKM